MRNLIRLTDQQSSSPRAGKTRLLFCAVFAGCLCFAVWSGHLGPTAWGQADSPAKTENATRARTAGGVKPEAASAARAQELIKQAHAQLLSRRSIRAELTEVATLTEPPLHMTGRYVSAGLKLRLEYQVQLAGGVTGSLTEVCDGERLWSLMQLPGSQRVTRRDVRQILVAAERAKTQPNRAAAVDLALGGLPALITSLQRSMSFEDVKDDQLDGQPVLLLTGRWTTELAKQLGGDAQSPRFPDHIPDACRLTLAADNLFPLRLSYFKRQEKGLRMLLDLRFRNITLDGPVDENEFRFTPPEPLSSRLPARPRVP
ncbi:MAG: hypothetical protein B7Z55_14980 [Planctomycetales bacterium 12-60-4]|nr:MAG: hypothetical protein B7Z55_14980 [Planctomycetales bacterium 12-60-4]